MARVPVLGKYLKKIQILENRISCDCNKVKLEIESKICQELWQLFFNGKYYGKTVTEGNLDSIEDTYLISVNSSTIFIHHWQYTSITRNLVL